MNRFPAGSARQREFGVTAVFVHHVFDQLLEVAAKLMCNLDSVAMHGWPHTENDDI